MNENPAEILKRSLAHVLPGLAIAVVGSLLMLGAGFAVLTEGAPVVRSLSAGLPAPWRALALFVILGGALVAVGYTGKRFMGYVITLIRKRGNG